MNIIDHKITIFIANINKFVYGYHCKKPLNKNFYENQRLTYSTKKLIFLIFTFI